MKKATPALLQAALQNKLGGPSEKPEPKKNSLLLSSTPALIPNTMGVAAPAGVTNNAPVERARSVGGGMMGGPLTATLAPAVGMGGQPVANALSDASMGALGTPAPVAPASRTQPHPLPPPELLPKVEWADGMDQILIPIEMRARANPNDHEAQLWVDALHAAKNKWQALQTLHNPNSDGTLALGRYGGTVHAKRGLIDPYASQTDAYPKYLQGVAKDNNIKLMEKQAAEDAKYRKDMNEATTPSHMTRQKQNIAMGILLFAAAFGADPRYMNEVTGQWVNSIKQLDKEDLDKLHQKLTDEYNAKLSGRQIDAQKIKDLYDSAVQMAADRTAKSNMNMRAVGAGIDEQMRQSDKAEQRAYEEGQQAKQDTKRQQENAFNMMRDPNTPYYLLPGIIEQYKANGGKLDDPSTRALLIDSQKRYKQESQARDASLKTALMDPKFKAIQLEESTLRLKELQRQLKLQPEMDSLDLRAKRTQVYAAEKQYNDYLKSGNSAGAGVSIEKAMSATNDIISSLNRQRESLQKQLETSGDDQKEALQTKINGIDSQITQYQGNMEKYLNILTGGSEAPENPVDKTIQGGFDWMKPGGAPSGVPFAPTGPDNGIKPVRRVVSIGKSNVKLGVPYKWGGTNRNCGVDCSGLTQGVYKENGLNIPRTAIAQWRDHSTAPVKTPAIGDLVFFDTGVNHTKDRYDKGTGHYVTHVGIYLGDGMVLQSGSKLGTSAVPLTSFKNIVGYKRAIV